jgi:hypothetical protein
MVNLPRVLKWAYPVHIDYRGGYQSTTATLFLQSSLVRNPAVTESLMGRSYEFEESQHLADHEEHSHRQLAQCFGNYLQLLLF